MNSSQVLKRTIPVLIVILLVVGIAVIASVLNRDKLVPSITDEEGVYLTINEDGRSYSITKKFVYDELKNNVGLSTLLTELDKRLLKSETKDNSNYFDFVTEEEIDEAIDEAALGDKEDLTEEEKEELREEYYRTLYVSSGLRTVDEVRDFHRLQIARRAYATDQLHTEIELVDKAAEEDPDLDPFFTEEMYENRYKTDYLNSYWAIIIPFESKQEATYALEQVGLMVDEDSKSGNFANLVKIPEDDEEEVETTPTDIALAFIEMYNTFYSRFVADYPNNTKTLIEGVHYEIDEEGKLTFNTTLQEDESLNRLFHRNEDVKNINAQVENFLKGMLTYSVSTTSNKWYTAEPRSYDNKLYVYMLKINSVAPPALSSVRDEIFEKLFEEELSDQYINKKMIELREKHGLEIFDPELEKTYVDYVEGFDLTFTTTKGEDEKVIAKVREFEITADELFALMDKYYGLSVVASEVNYLRFLNSQELNNIYDYYTPNLKVSERILDKDKWEEIRQATVTEKHRFIAGQVPNYPPTYGWKNFLRDYYGVETVEELMFTLLYTKLRSDYASNLLVVKDLTEDSEVWQDIVELMQKQVDEYFSVTGLQVMITVKDEEGNLVPQENWTDLQKDSAEELYEEIWNYIETETGDYDTKLNKLVNSFKDAPRLLASLDQTVAAQPELEDNPYVLEEEGLYRIEVSRYKTLGLNVEYQRISSLTNTTTPTDTLPEKLKEIAKEIYDSLPAGSTEEVRYGYSIGTGVTEYLISEKGYHVYINSSTVEPATWSYKDDEEKHVLPTLDMVRTLAIDNASDKLIDKDGEKTDIDFTQAMKSAVSKYFNPVRDEITGNENVLIQLYKEMQAMDLDFKLQNYSEEEFNNFLDKVIEIYEENLTYISVEE